MQAYDSMPKSAIETCTEIHIYPSSFLCWNVKLEFYAHVFPLNEQSSPGYGVDDIGVCIGPSCNVTPSILQPLTWIEADCACQQRGGVLVSINSEQEWSILTRPHLIENRTMPLVQTLHAQVYYIGLRVKVTIYHY